MTSSHGAGFLVLAMLITLALFGISGARRRRWTTWGGLYGAASVQREISS